MSFMQPTGIHSISVKIRRLILALFVSLFIVVTTAILVNAHGYRYNTEHNKWLKTGIIVVKTVPRSADIFLDGKKVDSRSPARITHVFPGDHTITISKEGYGSWEKRLTVEPHQTAFATDIALFKQSKPEKLADTSALSSLFWLDDTLLLAQIENGNLSIGTAENPSEILWSSPLLQKADKLLVQTHNRLPLALLKIKGKTTRLALFDLHDPNKRMLVPSYRTYADPMVIFDSFSSSHFYLQHKNTLLSFDIPSKTYRSEESGNLLQAQDSQLLLSKIENGIPTITASADQKSRILQVLPVGSNLQTLQSSGDRLLLWDDFSKTLKLFDANKRTLVNLPISASELPTTEIFSDDAWIVSTSNEVWIVSKDGATDFIDRLSTPVVAAKPLDDLLYLVIQTEKEVLIRALDNRDGAQRAILPLEDVKQITVDSKARTLYTLGSDALYSLELR